LTISARVESVLTSNPPPLTDCAGGGIRPIMIAIAIAAVNFMCSALARKYIQHCFNIGLCPNKARTGHKDVQKAQENHHADNSVYLLCSLCLFVADFSFVGQSVNMRTVLR